MTSHPQPIRFASFLGDSAFDFYRQVVNYLAETTGLETEIVREVSAGLDALLESNAIDAAFSGRLSYVWKAAGSAPLVRLVAAPVIPGERYRDQPIYYADLIVRADSAFQTFDDLHGSTFAYNETGSFSGYVLPLYHLMTLGQTAGFFGRVTATGSHAFSMDWVENGRADAAAIDSLVLEMEFRQHPRRAKHLRVIESLGPAGMPPVIASAHLDPAAHAKITQSLTQMHLTESGAAILRQGGVQRFAPVSDHHYHGIRQILQTLQQAGVTELS